MTCTNPADASSCYDMSPCYFTNVDRDLDVFCICYSLIFYRSGHYQPSAKNPNLEDHNLSGPYLLTYQKYKTPADIAHRVRNTKTIPPQ